MERLTEKITNKETGEILSYRTLPNVKNLKAVQQLGRYEDTGLTPEQVQQLKERDTAKKPDFEGDGYDNKGNLIYDTWICPNCEEHYEVDYDRYDFCPKCGQRLDFGGLDEI